MIPLKQSFEYICLMLAVQPEDIKKFGNKKKESCAKRIIQLLLRDYYGKNATYQDIADLMDLNVSSVYESLASAKLWLDRGYEPFSVPFRKAEKIFHSYIIDYYKKKINT